MIDRIDSTQRMDWGDAPQICAFFRADPPCCITWEFGYPFSLPPSATGPCDTGRTLNVHLFSCAGLGLHICTKQIAIMGGMFGVHSIVGSGSCFWFAVPLKENVAINRRSADAVITSDMAAEIQGMTVLVAEDNAVNQLLIQRLLTSMGVTSVLVADGQKVVPGASSSTLEILRPTDDSLGSGQFLRPVCTVRLLQPSLKGAKTRSGDDRLADRPTN